MLIIGSHVSFGKTQLLGATQEAISYGANAFMFYTGAPANTVRKEINSELTEQAIELMNANGIDLKNVICHAPYIVNLANRKDPIKYNFSISFIKNELSRCDSMNIKQIVLHPGSAVGITKEEGLKNIVDALNLILDGTTSCRILIETMAGKGSECGTTIEEIAYIINNVENQKQIGVCLDTCHLSDSGYDMAKFDDYLANFSKKIDLSYIGCIHINDSKNPLGAHKDRHANLGTGYIGFNNLINIIYNEKLKEIPKILETPYIGDSDEDKNRLYPPYKFEIEMIKNRTFDASFRNKIRNYYHK